MSAPVSGRHPAIPAAHSDNAGTPVPDARAALTASLATDTSDFAAIRRSGQVYVDKTAYIERMLAAHMRFVFLARPRRFGKSLLVSTLQCLYSPAREDLFQGLSICASGALARIPRCPVLALDMSDVAADNAEDFRTDLRDVVLDQCFALGIDPPPGDRTPWSALNYVIQRLHEAHRQKVVVLIDEYDAPLTDLLGVEPPMERQAQERIMSPLRHFYRILKRQASRIQFAFVTGISRVEGAGLFSSLNNLEDISMDPGYAAICGFTEAETELFLAPHVQRAADTQGVSGIALRAELRKRYDGYCFTARGTAVYNPISYLRAVKQLMQPEFADAVAGGGFPRPWIDTGIPYFLFRYMRAHGFTQRDIKPNAVPAVQRKFDLHKPGLMPLLFQTGFLTLTRDRRGDVALDYPNLEVKTAFQEGLFLTYLDKTFDDLNDLEALFQGMQTALLDGDYEGACACFDGMLDNVPFDLLADESHYQALLHMACLSLPACVRVESEVHTRTGKLDTVVEMPDAFIVFELKLNQSASQAVQQIKDRDYGAKYAGQGKAVHGVGVNFTAPKNAAPAARRSAGRERWVMDAFVIHSP